MQPRFLLRISFRRGDQASEAVGYFFQPQAFRLYLPYLAVWSQAGFTTRFHCMLRAARCSAVVSGSFMRTTKGGRGDRNCLNLARRFSMSRLIGFSFQTLRAFREFSCFDRNHVSIDFACFSRRQPALRGRSIYLERRSSLMAMPSSRGSFG